MHLHVYACGAFLACVQTPFAYNQSRRSCDSFPATRAPWGHRRGGLLLCGELHRLPRLVLMCTMQLRAFHQGQGEKREVRERHRLQQRCETDRKALRR